MADSAEPKRGVQRIKEKLQSSLTSENYYEAHQLYKTLSNRYVSQKKFEDALDLLDSGANKLLDCGQVQSGSDLALRLLDVIEKRCSEGNTVNDSLLTKLGCLHTKIPATIPERDMFVSRAIKCSRTRDHRSGHPNLHKMIAHNLWKEKRHSEARYHFLYSLDGEGSGRFLVEYQHHYGGFPYEIDMFVTQFVLQLLCLKNTTTASVTFFTYTSSHPGLDKGPPYLLPLLNFTWFLLLAINEGKLTVFSVLCDKYEPSISRDPLYRQYLDRIGQNFFGLPARETSTSFFGGLMSNLFSGRDEHDNEPEAPRTSRGQAFDCSELD